MALTRRTGGAGLEAAACGARRSLARSAPATRTPGEHPVSVSYSQDTKDTDLTPCSCSFPSAAVKRGKFPSLSCHSTLTLNSVEVLVRTVRPPVRGALQPGFQGRLTSSLHSWEVLALVLRRRLKRSVRNWRSFCKKVTTCPGTNQEKRYPHRERPCAGTPHIHHRASPSTTQHHSPEENHDCLKPRAEQST